MKPVLKAHWNYALEVQYDERPSNFAFKFNMRRYTKAQRLQRLALAGCDVDKRDLAQLDTFVRHHRHDEQYGPSHNVGSHQAGRCSLLSVYPWPFTSFANNHTPLLLL